MKARLTATLLKSISPQDRPFEIVDDQITGFLLRVQPTGKMSFYYSYRTQDGHRQRIRIGAYPTATAPAAREKALELAAKVTLGANPQREQTEARVQRIREKHESLEGFIEHKYKDWALAHQRRGEETLALLKRSFPHLYPRKMKDISAWDIQKWRTSKKSDEIKPATINRAVTTLKAVLNKAVEWEVITLNPLQKIKPLKLDNQGVIRFLSPEEEQRLRRALDERQDDIVSGRESGNLWRSARGYAELPQKHPQLVDYLKPLVLVALNTGLRRGELFNLKWSDVDFVRRSLTVVGGTAKSGQTRHVPLNSESRTLLSEWKKLSASDLVFPSPVTGEKFNNITKAWSHLRTRAELKDFRVHDLRHTFASKLVMSGVDLYTVKELMGHSTIQMTERYAHLAPEHKASAVERLVRGS